MVYLCVGKNNLQYRYRMRFVQLFILLGVSSLLFSCLPKQQVLVNSNHTPEASKRSSTSGQTTSTQRTTTGSKTPSVLEPNLNKSGTSSMGWNYIANFQYVAIEEMKKHGIPASIKMAQALIESGNGNSELARRSNNHFGIKCANTWDGERVFHDDDESGECFRAYTTPEESFRDHSLFLLRPRYSKLFNLSPQDYKGWAKGLKEAGYATNPRYADLLIDIIERYDLYKLDQGVTLHAQAGSPRVNNSVEVAEVAPKPQVVKEELKSIENKIENLGKKSTPTKGIMLTHEVVSGDNIQSIAEKYQISVQDIMTWNSLKKPDLTIGQLLIVSK